MVPTQRYTNWLVGSGVGVGVAVGRLVAVGLGVDVGVAEGRAVVVAVRSARV
jgi:hypothetical protein